MKALIMVDIQNDFCEGGSLAVSNANEIIPFVNKIKNDYEVVVTTQDFHPKDHKSFASNHYNSQPAEIIDLYGIEQMLWLDHCVQGTRGAEFHKDLDLSNTVNFIKGTNVKVDSYSGFMDNDKVSKTGLDKFLKKKGVVEVDIVGLALDFCVKATAIDAKELGYKVNVIIKGTKAVNVFKGDDKKAIEEMESLGISCVREL